MKYLLILLGICLTGTAYAQWSSPVTIFSCSGSTTGGIRGIDYTIDKNKVIHCVWDRKLGENYYKIYYSKSTDLGNSWSAALDISWNTTKWLGMPRITADTAANLHVTFDHDIGSVSNCHVYYKKFNGTAWDTAIKISDTLAGSWESRHCLNQKENALYCFWYNAAFDKIFYRVLDLKNNTWGPILQPYTGGDYYALVDAEADSAGLIHCSGAHYYANQTPYGSRAIYFKCINGVWDTITRLSNNTTGLGLTLALDRAGLPSLVWGQYLTDNPPVIYTNKVATYNGTSWNIDVLNNVKGQYHDIVIDKFNTIHVVSQEKIDNMQQHVHYQKKNGAWQRTIMDIDNFGFAKNKLQINDSIMFLIYSMRDSVYNNYIKFKYFRILDYGLKEHNFIDAKIFPNPFIDKIKIWYELKQKCNIIINITNAQGCIINQLLNRRHVPGFYEISWDAQLQNGNKVAPGLYFVVMQINEQKQAYPIISLK